MLQKIVWWVSYGQEKDLPVVSNSNHGKNTDIDAKSLCKRAEFAHESGQIPTLNQIGIKLERDTKDGEADIRQRQIGDEGIVDSSHDFGLCYDPNDKTIAINGCQGGGAVNHRHQNQEA